MWSYRCVLMAWSVPESLLRVADDQCGILSWWQCDAYDVTASRRHRLVRQGAWSSPARGVFDTGRRDRRRHRYDQERWRRAWTAMSLHPEAIALGEIALLFHGAEGLPRTITPEIGLPGGMAARSRAGVTVRRADMTAQTVQMHGRAVARPVVALVQAMRTLCRNDWVACADSMRHRGVISGNDLAEITRRARRAGPCGKPRWVRLVDGRAESRLETEARLQCLDAGIAPDDLQHEFRDERGRFLGRADLAWDLGGGRWLAVEIDGGSHHSSDDDLAHDAVRQNALLADGRILLLRFRSRHLYGYRGITDDILAVLAEHRRPHRA